MGWMNREPAEPELPSDITEALRQTSRRCPSPELLQASQANVLPGPQRDEVIRHLQSCPACQSLLAGLEALDDEPQSKAAERRIWGKIQLAIGADHLPRKAGRAWMGWSGFFRPMVLAATASAIVLGVTGMLWLRSRKQATPQVAQNYPVVQPATPPPSALRFEKAPVVLPAAAIIVWRGQEDSAARQAKALKQALGPYEADNYTEAARRLQRLHKQYPQLAEAPFYLGVSQLFLNQNEDAARSFKDAAKLAKPPLADDISWYIALAEHRLSQDDLAVSVLTNLCKAGGKDSARACAGAKELGARH